MAEFFRIQPGPPASIIELNLPDTIDALEFDQINEAVLSALHEKADQRWILDLTTVSYLGSAMLGLIVNVRQRIKSSGGKLVVCGLSQGLMEIFHTSSMERLFTITRNRKDALSSLGR